MLDMFGRKQKLKNKKCVGWSKIVLDENLVSQIFHPTFAVPSNICSPIQLNMLDMFTLFFHPTLKSFYCNRIYYLEFKTIELPRNLQNKTFEKTKIRNLNHSKKILDVGWNVLDRSFCRHKMFIQHSSNIHPTLVQHSSNTIEKCWRNVGSVKPGLSFYRNLTLYVLDLVCITSLTQNTP